MDKKLYSMHQLACNKVVSEGCDYVSEGNTKEETVADMMQHGGSVHSDLMKAGTEAEMMKAKEDMEKQMYSLLK
jgi:hypothetical protein